MFESAIKNKIEKVKKLYDYAFIHFYTRENAELALKTLQNKEIDGAPIEIKWAKPVNSQIYKIQKLKKGNSKFNYSNFEQTIMMYRNHVSENEYANSSSHDDEGISSGCTIESTCNSPSDNTNINQPQKTPVNMHSVIELHSMCLW